MNDTHGHPLRVVLVDLNNFATFPTLAVGLLVASLRQKNIDVEVLSPLAHDVPAYIREYQESIVDHLARRVRLSNRAPVRMVRERTRPIRNRRAQQPHPRVIEEVGRVLETKPDLILLSAYLQHRESVQRIGEMAAVKNVPVLLGGPMFNQPRTVEAWRDLPGLAAIVGGEMDTTIADIVRAIARGDDLLEHEGVVLPDGRRSSPARPLRDLNQIMIPDYTDFPWDLYRMPLIPIMTGRGCQWGRCTFCSDVVSASGRTFRTRSLERVMEEIRTLAMRHESSSFLFLDLKLNSNQALWRGLIERLPRDVPGAEWVGTVHVDSRKDNGLSREDLFNASASGMRRISFGLESGSQRILDAMDKGCSVERNDRFIRDAHDAGISIRCTMFRGYPGETADDVHLTADFLEEHVDRIDRIRLNELAILEGTPLYQDVVNGHNPYTQIRVEGVEDQNAIARHENTSIRGRAYRRAMHRLLAVVYEINRREIRAEASVFDGVM